MVTDEFIIKQGKEIEDRLLNRITDPEEKSLVTAHFRKLEAIRAKYEKEAPAEWSESETRKALRKLAKSLNS